MGHSPPALSHRVRAILAEKWVSVRSHDSPAAGPPLPTWAMVVIAVAIASTAIFLRLYHINEVGFNSDEAVYAGQGAAIAGISKLDVIFPVFRAHPLVFQLATAVLYHFFGLSDFAPRILAAAFGLGTVAVGYAIGARLYGRPAAFAAASFLAVMPYLVIVNRQALLDGPMTFFATVALYCLVRYAKEERPAWLWTAGGALGLTFITKETGILMVPAASAFLALSYSVRVRLRDLAVALFAFVIIALPYPLSLVLAGGAHTGRNFLVWQLFRPPNHTLAFYFTAVPPAISVPILLASAGGVAAALYRGWTWRETLLVCWAFVPMVFLELWPVKGYEYLLPTSVPLVLLAASCVTNRRLWSVAARWARLPVAPVAVAVPVLAAALAGLTCWSQITASASTTFLAGTGGVAGGRAAGLWLRAHAPVGADTLTIGPSLANILEFYSHSRAQGISVSSNPLHRNPAYAPVKNPDLQLRTGQFQYIAWDTYSAHRSSFFSQELLRYVRRYGGLRVYTVSTREHLDGRSVLRPLVIIYEVRP